MYICTLISKKQKCDVNLAEKGLNRPVKIFVNILDIFTFLSCIISILSWYLLHFDRRRVFFAKYFDPHAHDSKCLNEVYKAYIINHILYNKFLVKPN